MGCKFCATGTMGDIGSLWSGEILEQIAMASWKCGVDVRNVVFMGMGKLHIFFKSHLTNV